MTLYLNYNSEHLPSLKKSILNCYLSDNGESPRAKGFTGILFTYVFLFSLETPHSDILNACKQSSRVLRQLLILKNHSTDKWTTIMLIMTYNMPNLKFKKIISKHWLNFWRASASRSLEKSEVNNLTEKAPSFRDMLVRVKIPQPTHTRSRGYQTKFLQIL